jgi:hypothetical protein
MVLFPANENHDRKKKSHKRGDFATNEPVSRKFSIAAVKDRELARMADLSGKPLTKRASND